MKGRADYRLRKSPWRVSAVKDCRYCNVLIQEAMEGWT